MAERFDSVDDVAQQLRKTDYLADSNIAGVVFLADRLEKPVLVEGPAGVGKQRPIVFLTSNNTRELSEALKRRCLYLHIDYPDIDREKDIVRVRVPEIDTALADQVAKVVNSIRNIELKKSPSISETIDWA